MVNIGHNLVNVVKERPLKVDAQNSVRFNVCTPSHFLDVLQGNQSPKVPLKLKTRQKIVHLSFSISFLNS